MQAELEGEETLRTVLECALNGSMPSNQRVSSLLPPPVRELSLLRRNPNLRHLEFKKKKKAYKGLFGLQSE